MESRPQQALYRRVAGLALLGAFAVSLHAQQPQPPVFRSSVEVTSVDVGVVDSRGRPVTDLGAGDFTVQIDGTTRRVVGAEWISLVTRPKPDAPPPPPGYSTNENSTGGRLILLVIDQPNIRFGGAVVIRGAVNGFLEHLQPSDRVAVIGLGPGGPPSMPFTADRRRLQETVAKMVGMKAHQGGASRYTVTLSEALSIQRGEPGMLERVISRECQGEPDGPRRMLCASAVENEAYTVATQSTSDGDMTLASLRALIEAVKNIDAPKTLILVTEGFIMGERLIDVQNLGSLAAAARTSIYALRLDETMFSDITQKGAALTRFEDRQESRMGVETLANASRGSLFNITVSADDAFERIESELSGYYILGIESGPSDKDGKPHPVRVSVSRSGVTVRSRQVMTAGDLDHPRSPREAVMSALASPMMISSLPLTVATFPLQGPDPAKLQLLMHAAAGSDYSSSKVVTFVYTLTDAQGRIVESLGGDARLHPVMNGVPSALQYDVVSSLAPGEYTLKLAMAEGERVGTVEHAVHAWLSDAPPVRMSELMVGGPTDVRDLQRPTIGHTVAFGGVHGYIEVYGARASTAITAKYEVAASTTSPALMAEEVAGRAAGSDKIIFSKAMLVRQLPPGKYVLRALLSAEARPLKTVTRDFEIAAPPVLMTSAVTPGATGAGSEVYLPVGRELFSRAFRAEEALRAETLQAFRDRVAPTVRTTFDAGVASMVAKEYADAERTFKAAIREDADSTAALTYLAAVFAAAGYDAEASRAWQTALVDGGDFPEIYQWLGDALMRTRNLAEARSILEEAVGKWPSDLRFAKPLAYLYASFGQGREAVRTLQRYLSGHSEDIEGLFLGVQWIYELHRSGVSAQTRVEDLKTARAYASAYDKVKGSQVALVKQWMDFLEKPGR